MKNFFTTDNTKDGGQGGDYIPLSSNHRPHKENKSLKTRRHQHHRRLCQLATRGMGSTSSTGSSPTSPVLSATSSTSSSSGGLHSQSSSTASHHHHFDHPSSLGVVTAGEGSSQHCHNHAKSPLVMTPSSPTSPSWNGRYNRRQGAGGRGGSGAGSYSTQPRYFSLKRCSLTAILATTMVATVLFPHFPTGSDAATNESSGSAGTFISGDRRAGGPISGASTGGQWDLMGHSGVSAMHAVMRPFTDSVLFLERVQATTFARMQGNSQEGKNPQGNEFAWSTEFGTAGKGEGHWRSLDVKSNMFCSAGGYLPDGTVVSVAGGQPAEDHGIEQGYDGIRLYKPCNGTRCDWQQDFSVHLQEKRWYPTVEALATGDLFILGGSNHAASVNNDHINVPNFELFPPLPGPQKTIDFPFLIETLPNNLYPIVHLLPDKNLFILASTKAVVLSTSTWKIIKRLPDIPGAPRNYPLTGGSVLLPLTPENKFQPEILICGGATEFSTQAKGVSSCGRIAPLSKNPQWEMEEMPMGRMMPDMALLADGSVAILNGADTGTAGFDRASDPVLHPVQYLPGAPVGQRFRVWNPSVIARMYHSVAFMLPDMSLLVAGSNPNGKPVEYGEGPFPTEYRVERFSPPYLFSQTINTPSDDDDAIESEAETDTLLGTATVSQGELVAWPTLIHYNEPFDLDLKWFNHFPETIRVALVQPGFITHSTHMSQRFVGLEILQRPNKKDVMAAAAGSAMGPVEGAGKLRVKAPATNGLAPPSHYMLVVVLDDVPVVEAKWVQLSA